MKLQWPRDNTFRKRYITTSKAIGHCIQRKEITQPVYTGDVKLLANDFNEFFTTVGACATETSCKSLENENGIFVMLPTNLDTFFGHEFSFRAISRFEIRKIVLSFPSNKASGADKVSMKVIKDALPCILYLNRNH